MFIVFLEYEYVTNFILDILTKGIEKDTIVLK